MKKLILRFINDKKWRKNKIRYWLQDPFWGGLDFCCHYLFRLLPLDLPGKIGAFLGPIAASLRFRKAHQRADNNLKRLKPELSDQEREQLLQEMWRNIGQTMSEYSIADLLWKDGRVSIENSHYISTAQAQGLPMIFVTAHLGNWEIISNYCVNMGVSLLSLYQPERNRFVAKIAEISRQRIATKTVAAGPDSLRIMCKHLTSGGALWLAIDEYKNGQVWGPLLGRKIVSRTTNAAYAVRLAQRFNAVIIPYRTERKPFSHFNVTFYEPLTIGGNSDDSLKKLDQLMETWVLAQPEQWYMLHELRL